MVGQSKLISQGTKLCQGDILSVHHAPRS